MVKNRGHPPVYTDDKADEILGRIIDGESIRSIANDPKLPCFVTILKWTQGESGAPPNFGPMYQQAMQLRGEASADQISVLDAAGFTSSTSLLGPSRKSASPICSSTLRSGRRFASRNP